jgi:hypothetical protein
VRAARYADGDLRELRVNLEVQGKEGPREVGMAVNRDCRVGGTRLFLASDFGPAALVHWRQADGASKREAVLLTERKSGTFEGGSTGLDGSRAHLRMSVDSAGHASPLVEVRVMKDDALRLSGEARVGEAIPVASGLTVAVEGTPFWARIRASRDPSLWLAYVGFALLIAGATLVFTVVKLDFCLVTTPTGDREHVLVALKPHRFAPLCEDRFRQFVEEQGGQAPAPAQESIESRAPEDARPPGKPAVRRLRARLAGWLFVLSGGILLTSCSQSSNDQARKLVERYNRVVSEAYRRGDVKLIGPVVGPREGKKLTGLIGVRLDFGLTLDSHLLALEVAGVERTNNVMRVRTKERWRYRDLRIGSGEQVGEESLDSYEMLYVFTNINKAWLVDEIRFAKPPWIGRSQAPWAADRKAPVAAARSATPPKQAHP